MPTKTLSLGPTRMDDAPAFLEGEVLFPNSGLDSHTRFNEVWRNGGGNAFSALEQQLWEDFAPRLGAFDPNDPEFQAAMDALISAGTANIPTVFSAADYLQGVNVADGISDAETDLVVQLLASGAVTAADVEAATGIPARGVVDVGDVAREFGLPESVIASAYEANRPAPAPESIYDNLDINSVYLAPSETSGDLYPEDDFVNVDESGRDFEAKVFERGDSDVFQSDQGGSRYYGDTSAPSSAQDMFNQTYAEAMANEKLAADLETQLTPAQQEAQLLGLSEAQMNAKTEDMLDSILNSQGENETGFVNESARIAAEGILKGKILQAGVTDPVAQEAALKSAMESLEQGGSGLEAVKAAAGGAKDYVEELLKTAKDILDKGYDATIGKLPEILTPEGILADIVNGNVTAVFEIGETGGALPGATSPVLGGTVGTAGGGTNVGIMSTGNAVLDAVLKAAKDGVDAEDIENVVGAVIANTTGIPPDVIDAGIGGAKEAIDAAKTVIGANVTGEDDDDDDATNITLTGGTATTRTCDDGSVVGINEACPEDITTLIGGDETGTGDSTTGATITLNEDDEVVCGDNQYKDFVTGQCVDTPCPAGQKRDKNGNCYTPGVTDREVIDDDLVAKTNPCDDPAYAAANPVKCAVDIVEEKDCTDPAYAAANPVKCAVDIVEEKDCTDPAYAAANPVKCATVDLCDDPAYAAANPVKCGTVNLCDDPVYAAENPAKCGTSVDLCDNPAYAAENPAKCGTSVDLCDNPAYAAENPAKCGVVVPPTPEVPVVPTGGQGFVAVQTKPGELVELGPLYDISGSSIFQEPQESDEDALLRELGMYSPYAEGGIVQDYDIEELIRFLANQRG